MRPPPPALIALVAVSVFLLACTSGDASPDAPSPPRTPQTDPAAPTDAPPARDAAPADQSTASPSTPPPTPLGVVGADPGPLPPDTKLRLGESRILTPAPVPAPGRWVQIDPETAASDDPGGSFFQILYYDRDTDTFWAARTPEGSPLWGFPDPQGRTVVAWSSDPTATQETVLIDVASGDALRILPFPADLSTRWLAPELLELEIPTRDPDPAHSDPGWRAGFYHLDTETWIITYVAEAGVRADRFALPAPLRAGSPLPGAVAVELRHEPGGSVIVLLTPNDAVEHELAGPYDTLVPSPTGARIAIVDGRRQLLVYDFAADQFLPLGEPRDGWYPTWSPNGRYLARQTSDIGFNLPVAPTPPPIHITIYDLDPSLPAPRTVGAYAQSQFVGWRPDGTEALLLGGYCDPDDAFYLERVILATGERIRIPTAVQGFWNHRWSPRNDVIAVAAHDLPLALIDPGTGAVIDAPGLAHFRSLRDFLWIDDRWLAIYPAGGRDRCN